MDIRIALRVDDDRRAENLISRKQFQFDTAGILVGIGNDAPGRDRVRTGSEVIVSRSCGRLFHPFDIDSIFEIEALRLQYRYHPDASGRRAERVNFEFRSLRRGRALRQRQRGDDQGRDC